MLNTFVSFKPRTLTSSLQSPASSEGMSARVINQRLEAGSFPSINSVNEAASPARL
jgi:hypothetical protein